MSEGIKVDIKDIEAEIKKGDLDRITRADTADDTYQKAKAEQENARQSLAEWRWHWTRDTTNDDRVSQKEYARITGVSDNQISVYARGWEIYTEDPTRPVGEALLKARMGEERWDAVLRVARKRNVTPATAVASYAKEVKETHDALKAKAAADAQAETDKAEADEKARTRVLAQRSAPAQVSQITDAKSAKDVKALKVDASKVAKGKSADTKATLAAVPDAAPIVEAMWEAPTDHEVNEALARFTDHFRKAASEMIDISAMHIPADMIMDRQEVFNSMITNLGKVSQDIRNLMIAAEIDFDEAKSKIKKAQ